LHSFLLCSIHYRMELFHIGRKYPADDATSIAAREEINDEYGGLRGGWPLQCTEYATYRLKTKRGTEIKWPISDGRHGGEWGAIFKEYGTYPVSSEPKQDSIISFPALTCPDERITRFGHVAYVEAVYPDRSIKISEVNLAGDGIYNERVLPEHEWRDTCGANFIIFD